ncbi:LPS assembly lipoprotein LptE [Sulfitobacter sp. MF3-043]|uniref:LPS assembly lipoprotein LptE n=1 Tax=Sulfitobacter sediminivivens TaxID=3252902 RepID=UPI0036DE3924
MSLLNRRTLILAPLALAACGFEPVYGPGGNGSALQNRVLVDEPNERYGYFLTREIEGRLGRAAAPTYGLALTIATKQAGLATDVEGNTQRFNLIGTVDYALRHLSTGQIVTSGKVENFTGYSATGTTVATLAGEQDAQVRLMTILADQVVTRLFAADISG